MRNRLSFASLLMCAVFGVFTLGIQISHATESKDTVGGAEVVTGVIMQAPDVYRSAKKQAHLNHIDSNDMQFAKSVSKKVDIREKKRVLLRKRDEIASYLEHAEDSLTDAEWNHMNAQLEKFEEQIRPLTEKEFRVDRKIEKIKKDSQARAKKVKEIEEAEARISPSQKFLERQVQLHNIDSNERQVFENISKGADIRQEKWVLLNKRYDIASYLEHAEDSLTDTEWNELNSKLEKVEEQMRPLTEKEFEVDRKIDELRKDSQARLKKLKEMDNPEAKIAPSHKWVKGVARLASWALIVDGARRLLSSVDAQTAPRAEVTHNQIKNLTDQSAIVLLPRSISAEEVFSAQ